MTTPNDPTTPQDSLDAVIAGYMLAVEAGEVPNRQEWLDRHPEHADALRTFFADLDSVDRVTSPLRLAAQPEATGAVDADGQAAPPTVRYFGDYEIQEELGRGGMGVVYRARQVSLNRPVALKLLRAGVLADDAELRRFQNEAEAVALLDHPGIVPIYEVGQHEGRRYFSMKLIEGGSLAERLASFRDDPRAAAMLLAEAAAAVQHAHLRGVLHRDLKPANILIDAEGRPHITDFGLAKRIRGDAELTQSGAIMGTPAYMSPEQAAGRRGVITTATDVYGLGATLYALLTGEAPFRGQDVVETLDAVRSRPPESITRRNRNVPRDLELICLKCLEKDPAGRYPSAGALGVDLERFIAGEPVSVRAAGAVERLAKWARRKPTLAAAYALGLLALLLGGLGGAAVRQWRAASAAREALAWVEYGRTMELAYQEWGEDNVPHALALLESTRPDLRGWEWRFMDRLCHPSRLTLEGHAGAVTSASFSASGRRIISAGSDAKVKVWDAGTGEEIATIDGLASDRDSVSISPDGSQIITANPGGPGWPRARLWDARTGTEVPWFSRLVYPANAAAFSPDGSRVVATCDDNTARVWDTRTGAEVLRLGGKTAGKAAAYSPDGSRIVTAGPDDGWVWDAATGQEIVRLKGRLRAVMSVWFSPDGARVVTAGLDGTRVWDAATGAEVVLRGRPLGAISMSFSPDGSRILTAGNGDTAQVWDARTGAEAFRLKGRTRRISWAAFSPGGARIVTAGEEEGRLWDARTGKEIATLEGRLGRWGSAAFSPDGSRILTLADSVARAWDTETGAEVFRLKGHADAVNSATFSPDGARIVTAGADASVRVWDAKADADVPTIKGRLGIEYGIEVGVATFSPDWSRMVTANEDDIAKVWDTRTGIQVLALKGHNRFVRTAWFSPDGSRILTMSEDGTARVWDARTGAEVFAFRGKSNGICWARFSPDGSRILTSWPECTRLWDAGTGAEIAAFVTGWFGGGDAAAFSPDGSRILIIRGDTASVRDAATGAEVVTLSGHAHGMEAAWFSPDGSRVLTRGRAGQAKVWDAATGIEVFSFGRDLDPVRAFLSPDGSRMLEETAKLRDLRTGAEILTLRGQTRGLRSAWFSPDGSRILAAGADGSVKIWDAGTGIEVVTLRGPTGIVRSAVFSPDGSRIVITAVNDRAATVWDARAGVEVFRLKGHAGAVASAAFSPDGARIITAGQDETVRIWEARPFAIGGTLRPKGSP